MSEPVNVSADVEANPAPVDTNSAAAKTGTLVGTAEQDLTGEVPNLKSKIENITQKPVANGNTETCVTMNSRGGRRKSRSKKNGGKKTKKKTTRRKTTRRRKGGNPMKFGGSLSFSELNAAAPTKSVGGTAAVKNITGGNANVSSASVSNMFKGLVGGDAHMTKTMGGNTHVSSASIG